ncbi:MAG: thiol peroxidase [Candidatus Tectomicrobia bacterium]|nr:thiol peroxidase [Candidatus Tectomicrobia bacterium]
MIMPVERTGVVTMGGNPRTLVGPEVKAGDKAPNFTVLANNFSPVTLESSQGKIRLISVVPSLDTGVCSAQTKRFNDEAGKLPENVEVLTVSADLPFAQRRFCGAENIDKIKVLSDHKEMSFGEAYGVMIKEMRILTRAVFVVDQNDTVRYAEYVPEVTTHPNYDAVLDAVKKLAGKS